MNEELKQRAEQIFAENWKKSKMKISLKEFISGFPTLYNTQIIPSIVQALEMNEDDIAWDYIDSNMSGDMPEQSKIKPGQKLNYGDYCLTTEEQADELWYIAYGDELNMFNVSLIGFSGIILWSNRKTFLGAITEYSFSDFKQLCENTFGK